MLAVDTLRGEHRDVKLGSGIKDVVTMFQSTSLIPTVMLREADAVLSSLISGRFKLDQEVIGSSSNHLTRP